MLPIVRDRTERVLKEYAATRGDDMKLISSYYMLFHGTSNLADLANRTDEQIPTPESITRARRYWQNTKNLYINETIKEKRIELEKEIRQEVKTW